MPEVRFDVGFTQHPKLERLDLLALGLHVCAIDHAAANLTDGFVPRDAVTELARLNGHIRMDSPHTLPGIGETITAAAIADTLVAAGVWHEADGGYEIHDFGDYQVTKSKLVGAFEMVERIRERDREKKARKRVSRGQKSARETRPGDPPTCTNPPEGSSSVSEKASSPSVLPAGELDNSDFIAGAGLLGEIARSLRDSEGGRTLAALTSVSDGLAPAAIRDEFEALQRRRGNASQGPIRSESAWFVDRLKKRREREAARDLATVELLREIA